MHEGYIKSQGQFSLETPEVLATAGPVLVVNPRLLLEAVESAFSDYCKAFTPSRAARLARRLHQYFHVYGLVQHILLIGVEVDAQLLERDNNGIAGSVISTDVLFGTAAGLNSGGRRVGSL